MQANDFFEIFFQNIFLYAACMILSTLVCYFSIQKITVAGYLDPLHFYWTFTFGTAYGVVLGLFLSGHVSTKLFLMILLYSIILVGSLYGFRKPCERASGYVSDRLESKRVNLPLFTWVALVSYLFLAFFLISKIGFGAEASTNRFEQSRGYGAFVRVADALRLIVFAALVYQCMTLYQEKRKRWLLLSFTICTAIFILIFSSFLSGAKVALLEGEYVAFVLIAILLGRPEFKLKIAASIFLVSAIFAGVLLNINLVKNNQVEVQPSVVSSIIAPVSVLPAPTADVLVSTPGRGETGGLEIKKRGANSDTLSIPTSQLSSPEIPLSDASPSEPPVPRFLPSVPFLAERVILRVIGNADKYYLTLPNSVVDDLRTDSIFVRFLAPLMGSSRLSQWLGYDVNDFSVGRQALLHYDPNYKVAGGPTSHYDLFSYKYGTEYLGWIGPILIGLILSLIRSLATLGRHNVTLALLASVLWVRALPMLLEPPMGIAYIVDTLVVFSALGVAAWILQKIASRMYSWRQA